MHLIAAACRIRTPAWPAVIEATCGRTCKLVDRPDRRKSEAPPNPEESAWAIGRLRRAHASRTVALSATFGREARHAPIATMDIRVSEQPGVAVPHAVAAACVVVAVVVDIDRSES